MERLKKFVSFVGILGSSLIIANGFVLGVTVFDTVIRVSIWLLVLYIFFRLIGFLLQYNHDLE